MKRSEKEEQERRSILADLVTRASATHPQAKRVLEAYQTGAAIIDNIENLRKLEKDEVESASEFLGLEPRASDNKKLYKNSNTLAHRVILKLESLFPAKCGICVVPYSRLLTDIPLLTCWTCFRPSHDCAKMLENADVIAQVKEIPGFKWLCASCEDHTSLSLRKGLTHSNIDPQMANPSNPDPQPDDKEGKDGDNLGFSKEDVSNSTLYLSQIEEEDKADDSKEPAPTDDAANEVAERARIKCKFHKKGACRHGVKGDKQIGGKVCPYLHKPVVSKSGNTSVSAEQIYEECNLHTRYGRCKHGLSGKMKIDGKVCELKHPRICRRLRNGGFGKDGCNKGSKCEFVHPKLCRGSTSKDRVCPDPANCKFFHVRGARLTPKKDEKSAPSSDTAVHPEQTNKLYSDAAANQEVPSQGQDFCQALVSELRKGFAAQTHYLQQMMKSLVPAVPVFSSQPIPGLNEHLPEREFVTPGMGMEAERLHLPRGMGMTQGLYQPSQRSIY